MKLSVKRSANLFLLLLSLLMVGCATSPATFTYIQTDTGESSRVWPAAPEIARYGYVGELIGEENFKSAAQESKSFIARSLKWLVGLSSQKYRPVVLQRPQNGFVDSDGRILVTDVSRQAIYVFDGKAGKLHIWEMADENLRFEAPAAIVDDGKGGFFVTDAELGLIVRLDHSGAPLGFFADDIVERPIGLARHPGSGLLYVADVSTHTVKIIDEDGSLVNSWGKHGDTADSFNTPTYIHLFDDHLYITDTFNSRVKVMSLDGDVIKIIGRRGLYIGDLPRPKGVTVDSKGHVYVVESYYDYLLIYNQEGDLLLPIGGSGDGPGRFYLPAGVWVDKQDRIYVADMFNGRVAVFQYLDNQ